MEVETGGGLNYAAIIWRWKWRIGLLILIFMVAAGAVSFRLPKTYRSSAVLLILPPKFQKELGVFTLSAPIYKFIVKSGHILGKVVERMRREDILSLDQGLGDLGNFSVATETVELGVELGYGGEVMELEAVLKLVVTSKDPKKAAFAVNAWAEAFVEHYKELTGTAAIFREYDVAKVNLEKAEDALKEFESKCNLPLMSQSLQVSIERLAGVPASALASLEQISKESQYHPPEEPAPLFHQTVYASLGQVPKEGLQSRLLNLREEIATKKKVLEEKKRQVAEMEEEGLWVGLVKRWPGITPEPKETLTTGPLYLRTVASRDFLMRAEEARRNFQEKRRLDFHAAEIERKRQALMDNRVELSNVQIELKTKELAELEAEYYQALLDLNRHDKAVAVAQGHYDALGEKYLSIKKETDDLEMEIPVLEAQEIALAEEVERTQAEIAELQKKHSQKMVEHARLAREQERLKTTFDHMAQKEEIARSAEETAGVKIVARAGVPSRPYSPKRKIIVLGAGFVALILGAFLAFFFEAAGVGKSRMTKSG